MTDTTIKALEAQTGGTDIGAINAMQGGTPVKIAKQTIVDQTGTEVSFAKQETVAEMVASLGGDGGAAPANGTGVRGWLRGIYDRLGATLTDAQLRAAPVPVSGTVTANTGLAQPLTDDQLRATPLPLPNGAAQDRTTAAAPSASQLSDGTSFYDARQVRALTSADVVTVADRALAQETYAVGVAMGDFALAAHWRVYGKLSATAAAANSFRVVRPEVTTVVLGVQPTAQTITVSSSSASDTAAGTGARTVLVKYIRFSDKAEVSSTITLNGNTAVTVTTDGYSVNSIEVLTVGTGLSNAGIIYAGSGAVTIGKPANILALAEAGKNTSNGAVYTVPTGKTLLITELSFLPSNTSNTVACEYEVRVGRVESGAFVSRVVFNCTYQYAAQEPLNLTVAAGDVVFVQASSTAAAAVAASVSLKGYIYG